MSSATSFNVESARSQVLHDQVDGKIKHFEQTDPMIAKIAKSLNLSALFELIGKNPGFVAVDSAVFTGLKVQLAAAGQKYLQKLGGRAETSIAQEELTDFIVSEMAPLVETALPDCLKKAYENSKSAQADVKGHFYKISDAGGKILGHLLGTTHVNENVR